MSGSESENAIVVSKDMMIGTPNPANKVTVDGETIKMCSACRHDKPMGEFVGSTPRHEGQEMRTCAECRARNRKIPIGNPKMSRSAAKRMDIFETADIESGRGGRVTRRKTIADAVSPTAGPATRRQQPTALSMKTQALRKSLATPAPLFSPTAPHDSTASEPSRTGHEDGSSDTDEEYNPPASAPPPQSLKRQSSLPQLSSGDVGHDNAIQVRPPPPKRQRTGTAHTAQNEADAEPEAGHDEDVEDEGPVLNANGRLVGSDLAAFATSLGRLSQLLVNAGKNLDNERIGALESEIHHDWRVDEMATFVEGFLKGASANAVGKGW